MVGSIQLGVRKGKKNKLGLANSSPLLAYDAVAIAATNGLIVASCHRRCFVNPWSRCCHHSHLYPSSSSFFFLLFLYCFFFFLLPPPSLNLLPSSFLLSLFLHHSFLFSLFFFLYEPPIHTGVLCVSTPILIRSLIRVRCPKQQSLVPTKLIRNVKSILAKSHQSDHLLTGETKSNQYSAVSN